MSAWDDSWGYHKELNQVTSPGSRSQVTLGKIGDTRRGAERLRRPTPLTTDLTRFSRGDAVASATILRAPGDNQAVCRTVICPVCGGLT